MVTNAPRTRGFNCSNCGAAVELRALQHTLTVACTSCGAILDPRDPNVHILQTAALKESVAPAIPLGTRGLWNGRMYEVIGFQRRSIGVELTRYSWDEYVLFNPYQGFRYLSCYQGHWNDIRIVHELPRVVSSKRPSAEYASVTHRHFQRALARTDLVLGEFPWRVRVGDEVTVDDYVAPPFLLSSERTGNEVTWSQGIYTDPRTIWQAFSLSGSPPRAHGVFANQPSPYRQGLAVAFRTFLVLAAILVLVLIGRLVTATDADVFSGNYVYRPGSPEQSFVTETFRLPHAATVDVDLSAAVQNGWLGLDLALINSDTGDAWNAAHEISYYSGVDSDGSWTEGSRQGWVRLPRVPAGEYYLRVEPEGDAQAAAGVGYTIRVRRDVPSLVPYGLAFVAILLPPVLVGWRAHVFERRRLQEGDYGE